MAGALTLTTVSGAARARCVCALATGIAPSEDDWLAVDQFTIQEDLYNCWPDLVGFVNGLPLLVIVFKKPGVSTRVAFDDNLSHYKAAITKLF
jgi:type I restriction enzyme R subunit